MAISVICDGCEKEYRVKESMAGKSFGCKKCGEKVRIPSAKKKRPAKAKSGDSEADFMASLNQVAKSSMKMKSVDLNPADTPEEIREKKAAAKRKKKAESPGIPMMQLLVTLGIVAFMLVVVGGGGFYFAGNYLKSLVQRAQGGANGSISRNNLKQVGIGLHNFHDVFNAFPPGVEVPADYKKHSFMTRILPYMAEQALFDQIKLNEEWSSESNKTAFGTIVQPFLNPSFSETTNAEGYAITNYAGSTTVFNKQTGVQLKDMSGGSSNIILGGEVNENFQPWGNPDNLRAISKGIKGGPDAFGGPNGDPPIMLLGDGSVKQINPNVSPEILKSLGSLTETAEGAF